MNLKHTLAGLMRRVPFLYSLLVRSLNAIAARFTVGAIGVVYNQRGEILLLEHVYRHRYPWGLPGGWVGRREQPDDALRRELAEEVGLEVRVGPPVWIAKGRLRSHLETGFLCEVEGEGRIDHLSSEILSARWTSPDEILHGLHQIDREMVQRAQLLRSQLRSPSGQEVADDQ